MKNLTRPTFKNGFDYLGRKWQHGESFALLKCKKLFQSHSNYF